MQSLPHPYRSFALIRALSLFCFGLMVICAGPVSLRAGEETGKREYDLPSGDAGEALKQFSQQSGRGVIANGDLVKGVRTNPVKGAFTPGDALDLMLAGTGLVASQDRKTGAFAVRRENEAEAKNVSRAIAESSRSGRPEKSDARIETDAQGEQVLKLPEYLVTGSKAINADIQRTIDDPQPYVVFTARDLQGSGAQNLEDFFRSRLTSNTQQGVNIQPFSNATGSNFGSPVTNVSQINLRGLGTDETLILVDGRRAPKIVSGGNAFSQADLNGIPLAAIERIEILPSTAGGIYGGGATGGVINIIRRRDYQGFDLSLGSGGAFGGGAQYFRMDLNGGFCPDHGRTQITFSASQSNTSALHVRDNDLWKIARDRYIKNEPAYFAALGPSSAFSSPILGYTPNIRSSDGSILRLDPAYGGVSLGAERTFVPIGYSGVASDNGAALVANAGKYSTALSNDELGGRLELRPRTVVRSANFNIRHSFGKVDAFVDFTSAENRTESVQLTTSDFFYLPANATNNPFQQDIYVVTPLIGVQRPVTSRNFNLNASAGLIARLPKDWVASAEYDWSRSKADQRITNSAFIGGNTTIISPAISDGALNPIRDVNAFPLNFDGYITSGTVISNVPITTQEVASGRISGSVVRLPGGNVAFTGLLEHRNEEANAYTAFGTTGGDSFFPERSQDVTSVYSEFRLPIFSNENPHPAMRDLELQLSGRYDKYKTIVGDPVSYRVAAPPATIGRRVNEIDSTSLTAALQWEPVRGLCFRGSYATGFLPPSISQLVPTIRLSRLGLSDPKRGNAIITYSTTNNLVGNPNLRPELSRSVSVGTILKPSAIPGFRLSLDYTATNKRDEIGSVPVDLAFLEKYFPDRVVRSQLTAADQALGYTGGLIQSIDISYANLAHTRVSAFDLQARYDFPVSSAGRFQVYLNGTYQNSYRVQVTPISPDLNSIGYFDGPLKRRVYGGASWDFHNLTVSWSTQYYTRYGIAKSTDSATTAAIAAALQGSAQVPSQVYHDVGIRYKVPDGTRTFVRGIEVSASIQNVFNLRPPVIVTPGFSGTYSGYGDARLRRYAMAVRKHF